MDLPINLRLLPQKKKNLRLLSKIKKFKTKINCRRQKLQILVQKKKINSTTKKKSILFQIIHM